MCNPVALVAISGISAYMQYQQAQGQAKSIEVTAKNNAKIAEFNAQGQEIAGEDAIRRGAADAGVIRDNVRKANATGAARMAGSGLIANTGTNLDILSQNAGNGEFNALTVMNNAEREAYGYKSNAQSLRFGSTVDLANSKYQSKVTKNNGLLSAAGTFATGIGTYGSSAGWFDKAKA